MLLPGHILPLGRRALSRALFLALPGAFMAATMLTAGCASTALPCLQYEPHMVTRTVSMRGYGTFQVTEEALVCMHRANTMEGGLVGL